MITSRLSKFKTYAREAFNEASQKLNFVKKGTVEEEVTAKGTYLKREMHKDTVTITKPNATIIKEPNFNPKLPHNVIVNYNNGATKEVSYFEWKNGETIKVTNNSYEQASELLRRTLVETKESKKASFVFKNGTRVRYSDHNGYLQMSIEKQDGFKGFYGQDAINEYIKLSKKDYSSILPKANNSLPESTQISDLMKKVRELIKINMPKRILPYRFTKNVEKYTENFQKFENNSIHT